MVWHLIKPILPFLSRQYRNAALELAGKETALNGAEDSWKNCVTKTDSVLGFGTGHLFVREAEKRGDYNEKKVKHVSGFSLLPCFHCVGYKQWPWCSAVLIRYSMILQRRIQKGSRVRPISSHPHVWTSVLLFSIQVKRMLHLVKEEFILNLRHLGWMDDITTKEAVEKVSMF